MTYLTWQWLIFELPLLFALILLTGAMLGFDGDTMDDPDLDVPEGDVSAVDFDTMAAKILWGLGIGRVPLMVVLAVVSLTFGSTGMLLNKYSGLPIGNNVCVAFGVMLLGTWAICGTLAKILPQTESYAVTKKDLVGKTGTLVVASDVTFGQVSIVTETGTSIRCACRTFEGQLQAGTLVTLAALEGDVFRVKPVGSWN
jgi:hypothetical protein